MKSEILKGAIEAAVEPRTINLEPNWKNVRAWAKNGLHFASTRAEAKAFRTIIAECDKAKAAGRPNTDWEEKS